MLNNALEGLAQAMQEEIARMRTNMLHGKIDVSCRVRLLPNGMKCCSVQIQCKAGCGWLIESYGKDAEALEMKAQQIQNVLITETTGVFRSQSQLLKLLCAELQIPIPTWPAP